MLMPFHARHYLLPMMLATRFMVYDVFSMMFKSGAMPRCLCDADIAVIIDIDARVCFDRFDIHAMIRCR